MKKVLNFISNRRMQMKTDIFHPLDWQNIKILVIQSVEESAGGKGTGCTVEEVFWVAI